MQVLALYNLKGGVGKTAAAVNVAYLASLAGHRVLLWDLDPQGATSWYLRVKPKLEVKARKLLKGKVAAEDVVRPTEHPRLDLIPADFSYRHMDVVIRKAGDATDLLAAVLAPLADDYSLAVLDCPPSISRLSENVFEAADALLVPLIPSHLSLRAHEQMTDHLKKHKGVLKRMHAFFSMVDRRRKQHREWLEAPPQEIGRLLVSYIPYSAAVERMGDYRAPLEACLPGAPVSAAYRALWTEVRERVLAP